MSVKLCINCNATRPIENFYSFTSPNGRNYFQSYCKSCHLRLKIVNYETHKEYKFDEAVQLKEGDSYVCHLCDYKTKDQTNMEKHLFTKKHKNKIQIEIQTDNIT